MRLLCVFFIAVLSLFSASASAYFMLGGKCVDGAYAFKYHGGISAADWDANAAAQGLSCEPPPPPPPDGCPDGTHEEIVLEMQVCADPTAACPPIEKKVCQPDGITPPVPPTTPPQPDEPPPTTPPDGGGTGGGTGTGTGTGAPTKITCTDVGTCSNGQVAPSGTINSSGGGMAAGQAAGQSTGTFATAYCDSHPVTNPKCSGRSDWFTKKVSDFGELQPVTSDCPTFDIDLSVMRMGVHRFNQHCVLLESMRPKLALLIHVNNPARMKYLLILSLIAFNNLAYAAEGCVTASNGNQLCVDSSGALTGTTAQGGTIATSS